eukprot:TRINITY_DN28007_c0_g1_i1.p1 TRINITY_DN28007_c0_g1~~TRINITY_DN28007_c0_g1_i1.p1  ORF type:complete len:450 (+),score=154.65 TRINITY_DN28007_c0_g1_i1:76-1425(+)
MSFPTASPAFSFGASAPAASTGFSFGAASTPATSSAFSFGAAPTASTPLSFGIASTTGTSLFGAASTPAATTSLFGAASTPAATTSLFGAASTPAATTSLFGAASTPAAATSLFGAASTPATTTSLFGAASTPAATPSLFGAASTPAATASLFGTLAASTASAGLLGAAPTFGSGFSIGSTPAASTTAAPASTSLFGFGAAAAPVAAAEPSALDRITAIANAWNPQNADCRFRFMLYNRVPENEVMLHGRPPNVNEMLWNQAMQSNPDPKRLVPVQAVGFSDLKARVDEQDKTTTQIKDAIQEIQTFVENVQRRHEIEMLVKIEQCKQQHLQLAHRLIKVMKKLEVLRCKGCPVTLEEEQLREQLAALQREMQQPTRYRNRLNELAALVRIQADKAPEEYDRLDEESLESIHKYLSDQQQGLKHLTDVLRTDARHLGILQQGLAESRST